MGSDLSSGLTVDCIETKHVRRDALKRRFAVLLLWVVFELVKGAFVVA